MQCTQHILMIEPVEFQYNSETAANNYFQKQTQNAHTQALQEFTNMVNMLRKEGINVITVKDTKEPPTPDSIFPNNWISFHSNARVVLYPMFAHNRRGERRMDILEILENQDFSINEIIDFTNFENNHQFLEGTGSMILDRENKIVYAALSPRTNDIVLKEFCDSMGYNSVTFKAFQTVNNQRLEIYHTNVMMCISTNLAIVCLECIDDLEERMMVKKQLENTQKILIEISEEQVHHFAGNMLEVKGNKELPFLLMSETAFASLNNFQIETIQKYNTILPIPIPTIETNGGGSVRCMMAEIFLPKKDR